MTQKVILIVEDEQAIRQMLHFNLSRAGFDIIEAGSATQMHEALEDTRPDLILMDWMLPDITGLELTRKLKRDEVTSSIPIIMLTARSQERDKIAGLDGGADDYVTKPFSPRELVSRIKAVIRRTDTSSEQEEIITIGALTMDLKAHRVSCGLKSIKLGPTEYRLLEHLMTHPERVYNRGQLLDRVWGTNVYVGERTVDVHIRRLRKALEPSGCDQLVQTVRGAGYRFSKITEVRTDL